MSIRFLRYACLSLAAALLVSGGPSYAAYSHSDYAIVNDIIGGELAAPPTNDRKKVECPKTNNTPSDGKSECIAQCSKNNESFTCRCSRESNPNAPLWNCSCTGKGKGTCTEVKKPGTATFDAAGGAVVLR